MRKKRTSTLLLMKRLRLKLHSIPILINNKLSLKNNKLRYISYSIPLASIAALLLVFSIATSPDLQELFSMSGSGNVYAEENTTETTEETTSSASMEIGGAGKDEVVAAAPGTTAYRSHDITINVAKAKDYSLVISGPTNLTLPEYAEVPITGAEGTLGSNMIDDTWGYAWGTNTAASDTLSDAERSYVGVLPTGTNLTIPALGATENVNSSSNNAVNFTRKLVFAAKFSKAAVMGNYTAPVTLSLAVTPEETGNFWKNASGGVTGFDAGSTSMQGISEGFCRNNSDIKEGWTVSLRDTRETNKSYTVVKLKDGNCWMQENLSLPPETNVSNSDGNALTYADTDNPTGGNWVLPNTTWSDTDTEPRVMVGSTNLVSNTYAWQQGYGNYYNWCAAVAGACESIIKDGKTVRYEASGSICPRNWNLPTAQEYTGLSVLATEGEGTEVYSRLHEGYFKFFLAGLYRRNSLIGLPKYGAYVSADADYYFDGDIFDSGYASMLIVSIESSEINTGDYRARDGGSVRCVARY